MKAYQKIVRKVIDEGIRKENRTGTDTIAIPGTMFEHDMAEGFPLLTTKFVPFGVVAAELEFFIKGITDKKWLQDRGCHIWDEWCNPQKVPYGHDEETQKRMMEERDLGPIYGWQYRHFGKCYQGHEKDHFSQIAGVDQLEQLIETLKFNPNDRRMIVSAWNPLDLHSMALPPCHLLFQVTVINGRLNLLWNQRSVDVGLGLPFNAASYGLMLCLLAMEANLEPGKLVGFLGDTHIYENHIPGLEMQLARQPLTLPRLRTQDFTSIFEWEYTDSSMKNYNHHSRISFDIAV